MPAVALLLYFLFSPAFPAPRSVPRAFPSQHPGVSHRSLCRAVVLTRSSGQLLELLSGNAQVSPAVFCAPRGRPGAAAAAAGVLCVVPSLLELGPWLSWWPWCSGVAAPSASHALAGVCPSSWEQVNKGEGYDAAEELLKWSCRLRRKPLLMPLSVLLQAKDSDDDDEVTVSVDRDRFMDEFFEQVRALFLQGRFKASSDFSVKGGAGCGLWSGLPRQEGHSGRVGMGALLS